MQISYLNYKLEHQNLTMNERIVKWDLVPGLVMELVNLDKEGRRDFFINLPI